ncbi:MAG: patatin-like phospholipase family protein, partial [Sinobacteraceae bacterium]|nr:patatin-like phospholipase family protein [Nevskiaceae bacterium]
MLTGSSAGSLVAAMAATRNDTEMPTLFDTHQLDLNAIRMLDVHGMFRHGALLDPAQLEQCIRNNIGQPDFISAFEHTRRILGITVSPAEANQHMRLLNYLTAPHVLIQRAVLASCAVPRVFPPVMLKALDYNGNEVPYMRSSRWVDGSIASDLPLLRLARMHNVNHYIVSQTNPYIVPLMRGSQRHTKRGVLPYARDLGLTLGRSTLDVTAQHLGPTGAFGAAHVADRFNQMLQQHYTGDITL